MKIYTKGGDKGETSLLGGTRVAKDHMRIEAYGTVDELNSHVGMVRDLLHDHEVAPMLVSIQELLFSLGSNLAAEPGNTKFKLPEIREADITELEQWIDKWNEELPPLKSFILPGGHPTVSQIHITRTVCRRAERRVVHLSELEPVDDKVLSYLNRLSDFLFVLSRKAAIDLKAKETPWKPRG